MALVDTLDGIKVGVPWKGMSDSENTLEPPSKVYEDIPKMLTRHFGGKYSLTRLVATARRELAL